MLHLPIGDVSAWDLCGGGGGGGMCVCVCCCVILGAVGESNSSIYQSTIQF